MKGKKKSWNFSGIHHLKTTETYHASCEKHTAKKNSSGRKTKQSRLMLLSNCALYGKKKTTFIKNKEINSISND